nr:MAG TPA: hypothetical protein [Caudoviricetes sp.]
MYLNLLRLIFSIPHLDLCISRVHSIITPLKNYSSTIRNRMSLFQNLFAS